MARRNNFEEQLINLALVVGSAYLLYLAFRTPRIAGTASGIQGLANAKRTLEPYESINKRVFEEDLKGFTSQEIGEIIRLIIKARKAETLTSPLFKRIKNSRITGEFRDGQYRILVKQLDDKRMLMLNVFRKKQDAIPSSEIEKAERRLDAYEQSLDRGMQISVLT